MLPPNAAGSLSFAVGYASCGHVSGLSVITDTSDVIDPNEFLKIFENQFDKIS